MSRIGIVLEKFNTFDEVFDYNVKVSRDSSIIDAEVIVLTAHEFGVEDKEMNRGLFMTGLYLYKTLMRSGKAHFDLNKDKIVELWK